MLNPKGNIYPIAEGTDLFTFFEIHSKHRDANFGYSLKWVKKFQEDEPIYIEDITEEWGIGFKRCLVINLSHNSASSYLSKVHVILGIAIEQGIIRVNPMKNVRLRPRRMPVSYLTEIEIERLYRKIEIYRKNKRETLKAFLLAYETGLRISDIIKLKEDDIKNGYICVFQKKNGRLINHLLTDRALKLLNEGIPKPKTSTGGMYECMRKILIDNKISSKAVFHLARHTFASKHIELGTPVVVLKDLLGHSSIESTMWYVNPSQDMKDDAMRRFGKG